MKRESVPQKDDLLYKNYLLKIVDLFVTKDTMPKEVIKEDTIDGVKIYKKHTPQEIHIKTLQDLRKKFKQNFGTVNNYVIGANKVPIEVLKAVLIENLNFDANTIPNQGNLSDRQHLNKLISLSTQNIKTLSATYHIDLSRSDLEKTTRIRENILTLQSYLREGKFKKGYNPFFLYKDEWRQRFRTPFFPENHYVLKTGLFTTQTDGKHCNDLINKVENHKDYKKEYDPRAKNFVTRLKILMKLNDNLIKGHNEFITEQYRFSKDYYNKAAKNIQQLTKKMGMFACAISTNGDSKEEATITPSLSSAEEFRKSLDPANYGLISGYLFGKRPELFGDWTWHDFPTADGKKHMGRWEKGKTKGWPDSWEPIDIPKKIPKHYPYTATLFNRLKWRYDNRANLEVNSVQKLGWLNKRNTVEVTFHQKYNSFQNFLDFDDYKDLEKALLNLHDDIVSLIPHVMFFMIPICQGDLALAMGDFTNTAKYYAQVAREHLLRASLKTLARDSKPEAKGNLPWSWTKKILINLIGLDYPYLNKDCEVPFLLLRLGSLYLKWADQLYRVDQEPEVYRARELYKAVLRQYGFDPLPGAGLSPLPMKMVLRPSTIYDTNTRIASLGPQLLTKTSPEISATNITGQMPTLPSDSNPGRNEEIADSISEEAIRAKTIYDKLPEYSIELAKEISEMSTEAKFAWSPLIAAKISPVKFAQPDIYYGESFISVVIETLLPKINPAILAQQMRARIGITQIDAGLNYYGYSHNLVPILRYKPLIAAAKHFASLSKQAENDFLSYKDRAEKAELALIQVRSAVVIAAMRVQIESQRIIQAQDHILQAKIQVQQVNDAIKAKKAEIADSNSLCSQVGDCFSGMKDFFTGDVPSKATNYIKSDYSAAFGFEKAAAGTTAGLGVVGGMALFAIGATVTLSGMADSANKRVSELQKLEKQQLPMAMAALDARQKELAIAQLQKSVATFEALTAQEILRYSLLRTLNAELWTKMASAMKSVLYRYTDLASMTGWLAERALSYNQDRDIRFIRFDYFKSKRHGLLAADELTSDLTLLEKEYITGFQQTVPIKWTVSLARDFPLQFGQLKSSGKCEFMTRSTPLDLAYTGSYSHRIRAVEVAAILPVTEPIPRGVLSNPGISRVEGAKLNKWHYLVRPPDVFPLSEFSLKEDRVIYNLPGEALMPFEGSGIDTLWLLEFPAVANPTGLKNLADLCITFHIQAQFNLNKKVSLLQKWTKDSPLTLTRSLLFSAKQIFPESFKAFISGGDKDKLRFTITDKMLPVSEKDRKVTNVAIFIAGENLPEITGTLASEDPPKSAKFKTDGGLAHSNNVPPPAVIQAPKTALDKLCKGKPEQEWQLTIKAADNPKLKNRKDISDIVLGIEYTTQPTFSKD